MKRIAVAAFVGAVALTGCSQIDQLAPVAGGQVSVSVADGDHILAAFEAARIQFYLGRLGRPTLAAGSQVFDGSLALRRVALHDQDNMIVQAIQR